MDKCRICGHPNSRLIYNLDFADVRHCPSCDVGFLAPLPEWEVTKSIYDTGDNYFKDYPAYFSAMSEGYSEDSVGIEDYTNLLAKLKKMKLSGKILDVGCSTGVFLDLAQKEGWEVKGVELSSWASKYATDTFDLDIHNGTLDGARFEDESFDVVTLWDVLEHLPDPVSLLKEVNRILKPGGLVYLNTICYRSLINYIAHLFYLISFGLISGPINRLFGIHHIYYFSKVSIKKVLEAGGFDTMTVEMSEFPIARIDNIQGIVKLGMTIIYWLQSWTDLKTVVTAIGKPSQAPDDHE